MGPRTISRFLTEPLVRICYYILLLASFFIFSFLLSYHSIVGALHGHFIGCFSICISSSVDSICCLSISRCVPPVYGRPKM